ncbi:hypothetical protein FBU59_003689 [Linderina macrospora]|uniref:Uncharacterized protein n=1 Tax=Linderina macrospora TaxID=4868 RepID=A0ACC1J7K7_9FUNG|nr:hypothetical protein FBU59_003689 [Linderina macrospora]
MSTTMTLDGAGGHLLDEHAMHATRQLNLASTVTSLLTFIGALYAQLHFSKSQADSLRCRVVSVLSLSSLSYAASQLAIMHTNDGVATANPLTVRFLVFVATLSLVLNALLVMCAVGLDSLVRYGLRSFGLARRLSNYYEIGCFLVALVVAHPILYVFESFEVQDSRVVVETTAAKFSAAVWLTEGIWTMFSLVVTVLSVAFSMAKARKMAKYSASSPSASMVSVLGSAASIRGRTWVAACYTVIPALMVWKLAFRLGGSQSAWVFEALCIAESLQPIVVLPIFVCDVCLNVARPPEWLTVRSQASSASTSPYSSSHAARFGQTGSCDRVFTSWSKIGSQVQSSRGLYHQKQQTECAPSDDDINQWMRDIRQCHIRSDASCYDDYSPYVSIYDNPLHYSYDRDSDSIVLHPLPR